MYSNIDRIFGLVYALCGVALWTMYHQGMLFASAVMFTCAAMIIVEGVRTYFAWGKMN